MMLARATSAKPLTKNERETLSGWYSSWQRHFSAALIPNKSAWEHQDSGFVRGLPTLMQHCIVEDVPCNTRPIAQMAGIQVTAKTLVVAAMLVETTTAKIDTTMLRAL